MRVKICVLKFVFLYENKVFTVVKLLLICNEFPRFNILDIQLFSSVVFLEKHTNMKQKFSLLWSVPHSTIILLDFWCRKNSYLPHSLSYYLCCHLLVFNFRNISTSSTFSYHPQATSVIHSLIYFYASLETYFFIPEIKTSFLL